jgi:O-antigen/teichoic acid export membrane protein
MGSLQTVTRNVASNATGYFVSLLLAFFITPFAVARLGDDWYGLWLIIVSVTGSYGILDLGIRSAVSQYITRHWSRGDMAGLSSLVSTALAITSGIAVLLAGLSVLLSLTCVWLFDLGKAFAVPFPQAVLIIGLGVAFSFPMGVFGSAIQARERFDLANLIGIGERILTNALYVWALARGHGIVALAWITTGTSAIAHVVRAVAALRLLRGVAIGPGLVSRTAARNLFGFGLFSFLISISDRLVLYTDAIVIEFAIDEFAVTYYSLGATFIHHFLGLISAVAWTLTPRATALDELADQEALRRMWLLGSRLILQLATLIGAGLIFMGHDFLALWVGPEYLSGAIYTSSAVVMAVLTASALLRAALSCGKQVLFGMHEVRYLSKLAVGEAGLNLVLSIPGAIFLGNLGVALGTLVPGVIVNAWLLPRFIARRLAIPPSTFLVKVVPSALPLFAAMGLASWIVLRALPATSWAVFFADVAIVGGVGLLASWRFGLGREGRGLVLRLLRRTG